jgi:hypothetical protein
VGLYQTCRVPYFAICWVPWYFDTRQFAHARSLDEVLDFELEELLTISDMAVSPTTLAECPTTLIIVRLHFNRAHYNSPKSLTSLAESPLNYDSETKSPCYRLNLAECP